MGQRPRQDSWALHCRFSRLQKLNVDECDRCGMHMSRIVHLRNHMECSIYPEVFIIICICVCTSYMLLLLPHFPSYPSLSLTEHVKCDSFGSWCLLVICKADTFQFCRSAKFSRESGWTKDPWSEALVPTATCSWWETTYLQAFIHVIVAKGSWVEKSIIYIIFALPCRANRRTPIAKSKGCHKILEPYRGIFQERCQRKHLGVRFGYRRKTSTWQAMNAKEYVCIHTLICRRYTLYCTVQQRFCECCCKSCFQ